MGTDLKSVPEFHEIQNIELQKLPGGILKKLLIFCLDIYIIKNENNF